MAKKIEIATSDIEAAERAARRHGRSPTGAYFGRRLTGRCASGAEAGAGRLVHLTSGSARALCGARPGRLSAGWSDTTYAATCGRCVRCAGSLPFAERVQMGAAWSRYESHQRIWTAARGEYYLEVNAANGRCEISEWEPESASIGIELWSETWSGLTEVEFMRRVEDELDRMECVAREARAQVPDVTGSFGERGTRTCQLTW